ncbi:MaoC family dehydratase N-terminal domain-containing protein [Aquibacillus sp. 3ASR75-11]|uniref:MaoC family dehydratase N-terminal domain-containing protein n=1 Tax=Terrihalobacillus insolitus TaxID=2950438 RepID=A0A9X4AL28_9BACI|nr:MaoC/PaaZ C-terminal domain-containing protein [Terrihalobacillus insolitus]MDC3411877.1 MaoC family dehydratase N-terminal domain-containing protein [Terrihalobacillus insolitus]MDC3423444.1 MaoC family dehydratase N-terminal domain-containing protein [Terrihalobacillus insolitus]
MKFHKLSIGDAFTTQKVTLTKEDILSYAEKYDPQYFHVDEIAAAASPFGSLIASGFQTLSVVWAEFIKMDVLGKDCLGGLGAKEIKWRAPVKPGDQLSGTYAIENKQELSDGKRGIVTFGISIRNQEEKEVLSGKTDILISV